MAGSTIGSKITTTVTLDSASYPSPLTVTGTGNIVVSAYSATGIYGPAASGTLINDGSATGGAGSISSTAGGGNGGTGVYLLGGDTATNSGTISGGAGGAGALYGGNGGVGVELAMGAALTNQGTIAGGVGGDGTGSGAAQGFGGNGVVLGGGTLVNRGHVAGGDGFGGRDYGGIGADVLAGTLINTATIIGGSGDEHDGIGVYLSATASLANSGTIIGGYGLFQGGAGIALAAGGTLALSGVVIGGRSPEAAGAGVAVGAGGSLANAGTVTGGAGAGGSGVTFAAGGTLSNTGIITGGAGYQIGTSALEDGGTGVAMTSGVLGNSAAISGGIGGTASGGGGGSGGAGVKLANGILTNGAFITGGAGGYGFTGGGSGGVGVSMGGTLINAGTIAGGNGGNGGPDSYGGNGGVGVALTGTLTNTGSVAGGAAGYGYFGGAGAAGVVIGSATQAGTLVNSGVITGGNGDDVAPGGEATIVLYAFGGDGVIVAAHSTLSNSGTIAGGDGVAVGAGGAFTNLGEVAGGAGAAVGAGGAVINTGVILGGDGAYVGAGGTLTNGGIISGGVYAGITADAVVFAGAGTLVVDAGARFAGDVVGNASFTDVLYLTTGPSPGTLSGIGTQFTNFSQITIGAGASWTLTGADTIDAGTTLTELSGAGLHATGTLENDGAIVLDPSTLTAAGLTGTGWVAIEAGSTLDVLGTITSQETLVFGGGGAYLHLGAPDSVNGSITNFAIGETIDLAGIDPASVSYASGHLLFNGGDIPLALANGGSVVASTSADGADVTVLCFCANTLILTPSGEQSVQDLAVGDLVTTHRGEARPIVWIGAGRVLATRGHRSAATPVILRKGALADNVPNMDLRVTKGHGLWFDGVLIPAEFLVNHRSIEWDDRAQEVELYHIELASHDVLLANGAPAESYRDDGNRWLFSNANSGWAQPAKPPCAPVLTGGPVVDAVWRRLLERTGPRRIPPLTDDPDLHIIADGRRWDAADRVGDVYVFYLPSPPATLRIVSRAAVPAELGIARDPRLLGVALRRIIARKASQFRTIEASDARLKDGFHHFEADNGFRWTDGDARVPAAAFAGFTGPLEVVLHVGGTSHYLAEGDAQRTA